MGSGQDIRKRRAQGNRDHSVRDGGDILPRLACAAIGSAAPAIVTGVAGELHQIGANMVADVLENAGWNVEFLGTDAPHTGIVDAVLGARFGPAVHIGYHALQRAERGPADSRPSCPFTKTAGADRRCGLLRKT
jgi:hypothetical protein